MTQVRDCFSASDAMRLEKACYGWLYDYAPDIMECLDTAAEGAEAAEAAEAAVEELLKVDPPPREEVLQRGGLTPGRRGLWPPPGSSRGGSCGGDWQGQQIVGSTIYGDGGGSVVVRHKQTDAGKIVQHMPRLCDECRHLFGCSNSHRPRWGQCDTCDALEQRAKRQRCEAAEDASVGIRSRHPHGSCIECVHLFGVGQRPEWSACAVCDGLGPLWNRERGGLCVSACSKGES